MGSPRPAPALLLALALSAAVTGISPGWAQIQGRCVAFCGEGSSSPPSGSSAGPRRGAPSQAERRSQEFDQLDLLGGKALDRGDPEAAIRYYTEALKLKPSAYNTRANLANAHSELGIQAYKRGDLASAVKWLEQALAIYQQAIAAGLSGKYLESYKRNLAQARDQLAHRERLLAQSRVGRIPDPAGSRSAPSPAPAPAVAPATDASVVDLRHLDPNKPAVVDPRIVRGGDPAARAQVVALRRVQTEKLRDAVAGPAATQPERAVPDQKNRTTVLLDALEAGQTDWLRSFKYLKEAQNRFPGDAAIRDAMSYFQGLVTGLAFLGAGGASLGEASFAILLDRQEAELAEGLARKLGGQPDPKVEYRTWSLLERARALVAADAPNYEAALKLYRQAHETKPDHAGIRDELNYMEGFHVGQLKRSR